MSNQTSTTSISNMAMRHLGQSEPIDNFETDKSQAAVACRVFLPTVIEEAMRDFGWPFARIIADLALIEEDPNDEWSFSYRYPADCSMFKRILSGLRNDTRQSRVPYLIGQDSGGKLIFTDQEEAQCEYTKLETNVQIWTPDFVMAVSFLLASYIAPSVTKSGDAAKLGEFALKRYSVWIEKARANALNEEQEEEPPQSQFIRDRGEA